MAILVYSKKRLEHRIAILGRRIHHRTFSPTDHFLVHEFRQAFRRSCKDIGKECSRLRQRTCIGRCCFPPAHTAVVDVYPIPLYQSPCHSFFVSHPELLSSGLTLGESMISKLPTDWQAIAARKQAKRDAAIPEDWRIDVSKYEHLHNVLHVPGSCTVLSSNEKDITSSHDAVDLLDKMKSGTFSVEEVVTAFCKRAAIAQQLVRCCSMLVALISDECRRSTA